MKKQIVILLVIVAVCAFALFLLIRLGGNQTQPTPDPTDTTGLPIADDVPHSPIPAGNTFPIHTSGGDVVVKNFIRNSQPLVGYDGVMAKRTNDYDMLFLSTDQSVLITITGQPVMTVREEAEKDLLNTLGISQADACKLKINIRTTISVDPDLAGKELGLSFCK